MPARSNSYGGAPINQVLQWTYPAAGHALLLAYLLS